MPVFHKSVLVPAPVDEVLAFHRNPANLKQVQPPGARVIESDFPALLEKGSQCSLTVKTPFGIQHWVIEVNELSLSENGAWAVMVDRALESPFPSWVHRHEFNQHLEGTIMTDTVHFEAPGGILARWLGWPAKWFLWGLFQFRHYQTVRYFSTMKKGYS